MTAPQHMGIDDGSQTKPRWDSRGRLSHVVRDDRLLYVAGRESALFQILLVIVLGGMELNRWHDLGHDRLLEASRLFQLLFRKPGFAFLLRSVKEDRRAVLRSIIRTLAVELGGIVVLPEHFEQFLVGELGGVVVHFDRLCVAGAVAAHILVGRIGEVPAGVPHPGCRDPWQLAESGFYSPETARGKRSFG